MLTERPIETRSRCGSAPGVLNLAGIRSSPDRSTKTGFQVLFHSPPGVLFTFPSQYYALSVTE